MRNNLRGYLAANCSIRYVESFDDGFWAMIGNLRVVVSWGGGWEHVSVSLPTRCPTWDEMCWIKRLFWDDEECVVQFHPPKSQYVNNHPFCLHLWRPTETTIPTPPTEFVGVLL